MYAVQEVSKDDPFIIMDPVTFRLPVAEMLPVVIKLPLTVRFVVNLPDPLTFTLPVTIKDPEMIEDPDTYKEELTGLETLDRVPKCPFIHQRLVSVCNVVPVEPVVEVANITSPAEPVPVARPPANLRLVAAVSAAGQADAAFIVNVGK